MWTERGNQGALPSSYHLRVSPLLFLVTKDSSHKLLDVSKSLPGSGERGRDREEEKRGEGWREGGGEREGGRQREKERERGGLTLVWVSESPKHTPSDRPPATPNSSQSLVPPLGDQAFKYIS